MHPIRFIINFISTRLENRRINRETAKFVEEINTHARVYGLDPNLPELVELREGARKVISDSFGGPNWFLRMLNPYDSCVVHGSSHVTIYERMFGSVLTPWSIIEHHLEDYTLKAISRIRVDGSGTRIYAYDGREEVAHYHAGVLNPHRFMDPGNRVQNAVAVLEHFTGLSLDWEDLWRHHWAEFKLMDGEWVAEYDPEPVMVST